MRSNRSSNRCRVGREVTHPGPSPDPDKEISTIRLFRRCDSRLPTPDPDRDPWAWQRSLSEEIRTPFPRKTLALAATAQPLVPGTLRRSDELQQTLKVAIHAEGVEVASQTSTERRVLCLNRLMPMASTPIVDGLLGPSQARPPRLAPHPPVTYAGTPPIEGKPHKVKGGRTLTALLRHWRAPKGQQPCLVRMEGQSEAPQPFLQHHPHSSCIILPLKADDEVVTIADQGSFPPQPWLHLGGKPAVEHIVQIDVAQQRGEHRPLDGTQLGLHYRPA